MMNTKYVFTVFTPTYNRLGTLHRVFESLQSQSYHDFEWVIIDGGDDDTESLVKQWQQNQLHFPIVYVRQQSHGLHMAFNEGVERAQGRLFLPFHSDDKCTPDALQKFVRYWDDIPEEDRVGFAGVAGSCVDQHGQRTGGFGKQYIDATSREIKYRYKYKWEMWGFIRTDLMRQYPFPKTNDIRFIPEGMIWGRIGKQHKTRFIDEALRVYFIAESDTNSLMNSLNISQTAPGHLIYRKYVLNEESEWFKYDYKEAFRSLVHYIRFSKHMGIKFGKQLKGLSSKKLKAAVVVLFPLGYMLFLRDIYRS